MHQAARRNDDVIPNHLNIGVIPCKRIFPRLASVPQIVESSPAAFSNGSTRMPNIQ